MEDQFQKKMSEVYDKMAHKGEKSLTRLERKCDLALDLLHAVWNGGLVSYFYNPSGNKLAEMMEVLKEMGEDEIHGLVQTVCDLYPNSDVPKDLDERYDVILSWPEDDPDSPLRVLDVVEDKIMPLMNDYEKRIQAYFIGQGLLKESFPDRIRKLIVEMFTPEKFKKLYSMCMS